MNLTVIERKLKNNGTITISTAKNRFAKTWKAETMSWDDFLRRIATTVRTHETASEYRKMAKSEQDKIKDIGGFVGGELENGRRLSHCVKNRSVLTLDVDHVPEGSNVWETVEMLFDFAVAAYSTHKHSETKQRLRLIIPLSRSVNADEYQAVARKIADDIGIEFFDDTTYQAHRLMYWPSTSSDAPFLFEYVDAPWLNVDDVLQSYNDWKNVEEWAESSRSKVEKKKLADKQGDPLTKEGIVGAFCKTFTISDAISRFLSDVYEETTNPERYTYKLGSTAAGVVVYENKFLYSHHGTDPAGGKLLNAFDLVRAHRYHDLDDNVKEGTPTAKLPSYTEMLKFANELPQVKTLLVSERVEQAKNEFEAVETTEEVDENQWMQEIETNTKGRILSNARNVRLILKHDPNLKNALAFDEFIKRTFVKRDLPWRKASANQQWTDNDDAALRNYFSITYDIVAGNVINDGISEIMLQNSYHPVKDYLNGLPSWDGTERLNTLFVDYLGAEQSEYTAAVTRKMLVAAVARIFEPGIKYDNVLITVGPQGVGKSYILKKLGKAWFSDSVVTLAGKEAYEALQGAWLIELAELSATKKAEAELIKHFISKQEDTFRAAYARYAETHPRQCVFFGTTNDRAFLKDSTGNRRFWPIEVGINPPVKSVFDDLTDSEIDQIWAETIHFYNQKEPLFLDADMKKKAEEVQEFFTQDSVLAGQIEEWLTIRLPKDWANRDLYSRRQFFYGDYDEAGTEERTMVCAAEVWCELYKKDLDLLTSSKSREINEILRKLGWLDYKKSRGRIRFGRIYGLQKAMIKTNR